MPWTHCTPRTFLRSLQPSTVAPCTSTAHMLDPSPWLHRHEPSHLPLRSPPLNPTPTTPS